MQLNRDFIGAGPNVAASQAGGAAYFKVQTSPFFLEMSGDMIVRFLLNGSSRNMAVDATPAAPAIFQYVVPAGKYFSMNGLNLVIVDDAISPLKFGGIGSGPLANGIIWRIVDQSDALVINFHAGVSIVSNYEFHHLMNADFVVTPAQDVMLVNWRSTSFGAMPILKSGWKVQILVRDALSLLDRFEASIVGRILDPVTFAV